MLLDFTRREDHSVLISSHIVSDLEKLCDYIAFVHRGKLMLCQEKDLLCEQYGIIRCDAEAFKDIAPAAVIGKRVSAFGVEAIVLRDEIPDGLTVSSVSIEELFVFMVKEAA